MRKKLSDFKKEFEAQTRKYLAELEVKFEGCGVEQMRSFS
jgi:hypothetical protein